MKTLPIDFLTQLKLDSHTLTFLFKLDLKSGYTYYSSGTALNSEEDPYHIHPGTGADFLNNIIAGDEFKFASETNYIPIISVNSDGTLNLNNNPTGLFNRTYSIRNGGFHSYCWTSFDDKVSYDGNWYSPKGINFNAQQVSLLPKADSITLEINNVDSQFSDLALANEIRGKPVTIYQVALDKNNHVIDALIVFYGYTDAIEINQRKATVEVYNHMIQWKKLTPRRIHSATCSWVFKDVSNEVIGTDTNNYTCILDHPAAAANRPTTGANYATYWTLAGTLGVTWVSGTQYSSGTCQYPVVGAGTWCDQSWESCLALTNTAKFGGFRWLPGVINKDIWWGKNPAKTGTK